MFIIFNNDMEHKIPISAFTFNYFENTCTVHQEIIDEWTQDIISYFQELKAGITSIDIINDNNIIRTYQIVGKVDELQDVIIKRIDGSIYKNLELVISFEES